MHRDVNPVFLKPAERVPGWDLLRGMCAVAVASYHLMYWQDLATVHTLGSYGVYLFFILSGASLAYTYLDKFTNGQFSFKRFLWVRYLRLIPLYLALMLLVLPWKLVKGTPLADLLINYFLNAFLLFGFYNPASNATLIGGWSLGIEVIFYLLFPLLMLSFKARWLAWCTFGAVLLLQLTWISITLGAAGGYALNSQSYHQAPSFAAYFMGGCLLGVAKRKGVMKSFKYIWPGVVCLMAGFALAVALNPTQQGDELVGWRGAVLFGLCFVLVYLASRLDLKHRMQTIAQYFGDATYGLYLLHPVIFFGLTFAVFPSLGISNPVQWPVYGRIAFLLLVLLAAFGLALLSERYFEKPVRQFGQFGRLRTRASA
jgi:peptidoglycan/LPS O-acetylase OafA/YrhL